MAKRKAIPKDVRNKVLVDAMHRCCLCPEHQEEEDGLERGLHRRLGVLLSYGGRYSEAELEISYIPLKFRRARQSDIGPLGELSLYALFVNNLEGALSDAAYMQRLAYKFQRESDIIRAEWLLGIVHFRLGDLSQSQRHLNEAIVRCRRVNLVELEPDILLAWARWHRAKSNPQQAREHAEEALSIADRCEYRLVQADIHNFLAQVALEKGNREEARKHAEIARERAWCDGPPHCYKPALEEAERILESLEMAQS
jgi:tetratricopeptide (TPR) repeat protein